MPTEPGELSGPSSRARLQSAKMVAVAAIVVAVDQATKAWAVSALRDHSVRIAHFVELRLTRNTGSAFSLFTGQGVVLAVLAIGMAVLLVHLGRRETDAWVLVALALVLGGAVGNLIDRLARGGGFVHGAVVDFIDIGAWPTFNVADAAITVGAVLLVLRTWRHHEATDHG